MAIQRINAWIASFEDSLAMTEKYTECLGASWFMFNFNRTVIGHRGACGYAPENTMAAMRKAKELGVQWVEFDVMLTRDEAAIIMHDIKLNRTTNGRGEVAQTDYASIATLDAGNWFSKEFVNEKVPTFIDLLGLLKKLDLHMNVEIKPTPGQDILTAQKTLAILHQYWPNKQSRPLISSGSLKSLLAAREQDDAIALGWITNKIPADWEKILMQFGGISLHVNHKNLNAANIAAVKTKDYLLLAYTVNDPKHAKTLFDWGVDAIFTDFPDRIMRDE